MSFVRVGRPQQHSKVKRPVRPKKTAATKKDWVSTVNDLSVHKPTPAELNHRHELHKSHNKAAAQWELREKALKRRLRHGGSPAPLDQASLSIIREVFSDQLLLQDVLARSDRAMAVVKDLFGDAPRRQTGHLSVTVAPNCESDTELPVLQRPDPPTQLSLLSQSMMDQQALNELDISEEDVYPNCTSEYHEIRRANVRKCKAHGRGRVSQQQRDHSPKYHQADRDQVPVTPVTSGRAPDQAALNATVAVQRVRSRQSHPEETKQEPSLLLSHVLNPDVPLNQSGKTSSRTIKTRKCVSQVPELDGSSVASLNGDQSSLGMLQAMLGQVEAELDTLSPATTPCSAQSPEQDKPQGLTGFSVSLVSTLGRLVHLLKQREDEAQKEAEERRRLEEELREQQGLVDALTAETMTLREEASSLQAVVQRQTAELEQKLDTIMLVMAGLGLLESPTDPLQDPGVKAAVFHSAPVPQRPPEQTQAPVYPAVLLSPPRQRDNWQHIPAVHPVHQQMSHIDTQHSFEDLKTHSSASSLASLPLSSIPSTSFQSLASDPLSSQCHAQGMLAEIVQLSHNNCLLRAQLCQAKGLGSGVGSPESCEQRRLSPCSTGRITPQGVEESKRSNSTGRQSQKILASEREKLAYQASSSNTASVSSVEQRLRELNRQSAAARARLLELIEQQKQSVSSKGSPSGSPVPHSAFSPHTAVEGGSPDVSLLLPAQDLVCQNSGGEKRLSGSEVSSVRHGEETRDGKTQQMEKQRAPEGWFALSAHVR